MRRKQNFQTIAWFWDLYQRDRLDMDPRYQRRSVWNQSYRDYFVDTVLLGYPSPAIFLFEEITPDGRTLCHVVDGKQRLLTLFEFVQNRFPVSKEAKRVDLCETNFRDFKDDVKREFWGYLFSVEYVPTEDEAMINDIFDRINRNTAKLTAQELRHAKFSGQFITRAEELAQWMMEQLPPNFPNISGQTRRQMKDVELTAHLLLLLEEGPRSYTALELDEAFSDRDEQWDAKSKICDDFRNLIHMVKELCAGYEAQTLIRSRLKNQTDFYSLFGAMSELLRTGASPDVSSWRKRLIAFVEDVDDDKKRADDRDLRDYYDAARSASTNTEQRRTRISITSRILQGKPLEDQDNDSTDRPSYSLQPLVPGP